MKKVRLKDVARIAGVSPATVDRVLNGRPGVRPETARRVAEAMARVGYAQSSLQAQLGLAEIEVTLLLPQLDPAFLTPLRTAFENVEAERPSPREAMRIIDSGPFSPDGLVAALDGLTQRSGTVVTIGLHSVAMREAIDRLVADGARVVTILADCPGSRRAAHVGLDNFAAGATAGALMRRFLPDGVQRLGVLIDDARLRVHLDRRSGFEQALAGQAAVSPMHLGGDRARAEDLIAAFLADAPGPAGLYLTGAGHDGAASALDAAGAAGDGTTVIVHELTGASRRALVAGAFAAVIAQDLDEVARRAFEAAHSAVPEDVAPLPIRIWIRENLAS